MHDPLGDALVVEVRDLLAEDEVLEEGGPRSPALSEFWLSAIGLPEVRRERLPAGVDAHPVERRVARVEAERRGRAGLGGLGLLGQRAGGDRRVGGLGGRAGLRPPGGVSDLAGLVPVEGEGRRQRLRLLHLRCGCVGAVAIRATGSSARAADGRLRGALSRGWGLSDLGHRCTSRSREWESPPAVVVRWMAEFSGGGGLTPPDRGRSWCNRPSCRSRSPGPRVRGRAAAGGSRWTCVCPMRKVSALAKTTPNSPWSRGRRRGPTRCRAPPPPAASRDTARTSRSARTPET